MRRRVYYDDTDSGGVVYHTQYLKFMEHARSEFLDARGYAPWLITEKFGVQFVVTELTIRYLAPARLGDQLEIEAVVKNIAGVTVYFEQSVWLLNATTKVREIELARADVKAVCLGADNFKPARIPSEIQESILSEC
ncbi:MAG: YbgC/FadM family acyl-CoA thioesterase [Gammaproteobacteria bacterium]|nr:YbgC/FadM family acyl-CoA thioesterase [Gammaproteobacteria bacterium]